MKKIILPLLVMGIVLGSTAYAQDISLPAPATKAGVDLLAAIDNRSVARQFVKHEVPLADLSTVLWAGIGQRSPDAMTSATKSNRTTSFSGDNAYIKAYVLNEKGVFLYDSAKNLLKQVNPQDIRATALPEFIATGAFVVVFVADGELLPAFLKGNAAMSGAMTNATAGFAAQNVSLAASAAKMSSIVMYNIKAPILIQGAKLAKLETPLFCLQVGYTK